MTPRVKVDTNKTARNTNTVFAGRPSIPKWMMSCLMLRIITTFPTNTPRILCAAFETYQAAKGAAMGPPIIRPKTASHGM